MKPKEIYGLSRNRDKKGNVVKRNLNPYVNCLHTLVGSCRENMEVYVAEFMEECNNGGCSPTILSRDFKQPKMIMEEVKIAAMRGRNPENPSERGKSNGNYQQRLEINENGTSNTLTSVQKDNLVIEPVLTPKRTEFGKQVRKQYESGELDMSRHDMTELKPRTDGVSNTLTSVQKDNLVAEPLRIPEATARGYAEATEGDSVNLEQPNSKTRRGRVGKQMANTLTTSCNQGVVIGAAEPLNPYKDGTCRTIKAQYQQSSRANFARQDGLGATGVVEDWQTVPGSKQYNFRGHAEMRYRIRKLTPRECFRLMDVDENVIDTIQAAGISNSQQYKLAGNSIVVACLEKIFEQMFFPQYTNSRTLFG